MTEQTPTPSTATARHSAGGTIARCQQCGKLVIHGQTCPCGGKG